MENKIGFDPTLMRLGYFSKGKAAEGTRQLMGSKPDITAFFVVSDEMAIAVIETLREMGRRVPDDISVVGFDDIKEAEYFVPRLTTVRQNKYELGSEAARILLKIIENPDYQPKPVTLPCQLIVRQSTAAAKTQG